MSRSARGAPSGATSLLAIPAFLLLYAGALFVWPVPGWIADVYLGASAVCLVAYAIDKAAARAGRRRVSERTLLALGLIGGWPGALVAQQVFRHKTAKASFRIAFWVTVAVNVAGFVALSAMGPRLRGDDGSLSHGGVTSLPVRVEPR